MTAVVGSSNAVSTSAAFDGVSGSINLCLGVLLVACLWAGQHQGSGQCSNCITVSQNTF